MRIIKTSVLKDFYIKHQKSENPLKSWIQETKKNNWRDPSDVKSFYRSADILKNNRIVFNIGGNKYRLIVKVNYKCGVVYIRFIGSHEQYNKVNAEEV